MQQYHVCSADCSFTRRRGSVYFCRHAGGLHICGPNCNLDPIETVEGSFCPWTGSQVHGAKCMQYANYLSKTPFAGKTQAVHWTSETIKRQPKRKDPSIFLHNRKNVKAAMRIIFSSSERAKLQEQQRTKMKAFFKHAVKQQKKHMSFASAWSLAKRASKKWPAIACSKIAQDHAVFEKTQRAIVQYIAVHSKMGLVIKNTKAFVAALLTLLAKGLVINNKEFVPKNHWISQNIIPPNYMTAVGIPCRAVSLAVRAIKMYMYGPEENGIPEHAFLFTQSPNPRIQLQAQVRLSTPSESRQSTTQIGFRHQQQKTQWDHHPKESDCSKRCARVV